MNKIHLDTDLGDDTDDLCALVVLLRWPDVEIKEVPLKFEVRESYLHEMIDNSGKPIKVVTKVDGDKFNEFWLNVVNFK